MPRVGKNGAVHETFKSNKCGPFGGSFKIEFEKMTSTPNISSGTKIEDVELIKPKYYKFLV